MSEKEMEHMNSIYKKLKTIKFEIIIVSIALFVLGLLLVIFPRKSYAKELELPYVSGEY